MKRIQTYFAVMLLAAVMTGCGEQGNVESTVESAVESVAESTSVEESVAESTEESVDQSVETVASDNGAADALNAVWAAFSEENQFPAYGGSVTNPIDSAAGGLDVADTDTLTYTLLIPAELQGDITEAASLIHFMNANTFTGAALKVDAAGQDAFVASLKDAILNAQFMCGFPEKLVIVTSGDYVLYAFGAEDFVNEFETNALANLEGAKAQVSELF